MSGEASRGGAAESRLSGEMAARYAMVVHRVSLSSEEARWFAAEMARTSRVVAEAAAAAGPLFDVRMETFDALSRGGEAE